jgi:hypothetical protein
VSATMLLKLLKTVKSFNFTAILFLICIFLLVINYINISSLNEANRRCKELIEISENSHLRLEARSKHQTVASSSVNFLNITTTASTSAVTTTLRTTALISTNTTKSRTTSLLETSNAEKLSLQFPSILRLLPHLKDRHHGFEHRIEITQNRNARFVMGVPTVKRDKANYIIDMLKSLLKAMNAQEMEDVLIVVFVSEVSCNCSPCLMCRKKHS